MSRQKTRGVSEKRESKLESIEMFESDSTIPLPPVPAKITSSSPRGKSVSQSTLQSVYKRQIHAPNLSTVDLRTSFLRLIAPKSTKIKLAPGEATSHGELVVDLTGFLNQLLKIAFMWRGLDGRSVSDLFEIMLIDDIPD